MRLQHILRVVSAASLVGLVSNVLSQNDANRCVSENDTQSLDENVSCEFLDDLCGWRATGKLEWIQKTVASAEYNYSSVDVTNQPGNSSARLWSPWLCAVEHGAYSFSFYYLLPTTSRDRCRLALFVSSGDDTRSVKLWTATSSTLSGEDLRKPVTQLFIRCTGGPFQIFFEAEKLSEESCGDKEMGIDAINIKHSTRIDGPLATCPSPVPASDGMTGDDNGCFREGTVAGIVVGVVVFVFIVNVIVFLIIARRGWNRENGAISLVFKFCKRSPRQNAGSCHDSQAASNTDLNQYESTSGLETPRSGIHYGHEAASDPAGPYTTPYSATHHAGTRGPRGAASRSVGDDSGGYNELTFKTQHSTQDTRSYDHLKSPQEIQKR